MKYNEDVIYENVVINITCNSIRQNSLVNVRNHSVTIATFNKHVAKRLPFLLV